MRYIFSEKGDRAILLSAWLMAFIVAFGRPSLSLLNIPHFYPYTRLTYPLTPESDFGETISLNICLPSYGHGTTPQETSFGAYSTPPTPTPTPELAFANFLASNPYHYGMNLPHI